MWGRLQARKSLAGPDDALDPIRVGIVDIQRAMAKASVIRRDLSTAGNGLRHAAEHLDAMNLDVTDVLARLRATMEQ